MSLAAVFTSVITTESGSRVAQDAATNAALESVLKDLWQTAITTCTSHFDIQPQEFIHYVAERITLEDIKSAKLISTDQLLAALTHVRGADLLLAMGCLRGYRRAIDLFDKDYLVVVRHALGSSRHEDDIQEVMQTLRERLLVGDAAKLSSYRGRGDLRSWLRVTAARTDIERQRGVHGRLKPTDELALETLVNQDSAGGAHHEPTLDWLKASYRAMFEAAFRQALSALPIKQRNLLRLHYLDGLTLDALARMNHVHRATVARWLSDARQRVLDGTRTTLCLEHHISAHEVDGIIQSVASRLDETLGGVMRTDVSATEP